MIEFKEAPDEPGLYLCYVNPAFKLPFAERVLLMWYDGVWTYPKSDQRFRDTVYECAGPLPTMRLTDD